MVSVQFLPEDKAGLLSTVLESLLYGFSLLMFIATLVILLRGQTWAQVNKPMVVVACCLFILSTIHLAVDINRLNIGLILDRDGYPGGPAAFFANPSENTFVFKNAVYSFQTVLGDGVVIYRCYKVWKSVWVIIFPCLLWIGVAITAAGSVYSCTRPSSTDTSDIFVKELGQWITSFYSMTFSCNLVATILLASRLYMIHRGVRNSRVGNGRTMGILLIIVDAGALYSMTLLAALITFALKTNGQYVVLDMVTPIISIAFYMVIVRVGIARHNNSRSNTSNNNQTAPRVPMSRQEASGGRLGSKPMHVRIQVEQETESGRRSPEKGEDPNDLPMEPYRAV